jgi:type II secretory pathway component GspD/PulD (secretin)
MMGVLVLGLAGAARAQEAGQDAAPNELPTSLVKILRTTNKAQTNRYVPRVYTISNVNPYDLFRWVRRTAQIEEGAFYFFGKPNGEGRVDAGKIVLTVPEYMAPGIDEMMALIDREGLTSSSGETFYYFRPRHRHVFDTGFTDVLEALVGTSGDTATDDEVNKYVVYAAPSKVADVARWLPSLDVPPPQVMIEVTVYETRVDNEADLGLDYVAWKNGPGRNAFAFGAFAERSRVHSLHNATTLLDDGVSGGTFGLPGHQFENHGSNGAYFLDVPSAFFDYLVVKGKARIMTSAKVNARNLVEAQIAAEDTILYYTARTGPAANAGIRPQGLPLDPTGSSSLYPDNRTVVGAQEERLPLSSVLAGETAGLKLTITPVIAEREISLDIETFLVSHVGFDSAGAPLVNDRSFNTRVQCVDGQEVVLGGFTRETVQARSDKIPFLGSLPLLGYLFGGEGNRTERRHVTVVLTPHVVKDFSGMRIEGTKIDAALIKSKAMREQAAEVPHTDVGFDQWLLDAE